MDNVGNTGRAAFSSGAEQNNKTAAKPQTFQHSQFGGGVAAGVDASLFEEAAMHITSSRKIDTKKDKKDKADLKKLLELSKKKVPDMPGAGKLEQCLQQLQGQHKTGSLNKNQIKNILQEYSRDHTHQYLALEDLIAFLSSESGEDDDLVQALKEYNNAFYEEERVSIQAGLNISGTAADFADQSTLGDVGELRDIWRSALQVPELDNILEAFNFALEKAGSYEKVGEGIRWMTDALARELDMGQAERSVDAVQMLHVRRQLECVFGIKTTYESCVGLEGKLQGMISDELRAG